MPLTNLQSRIKKLAVLVRFKRVWAVFVLLAVVTYFSWLAADRYNAVMRMQKAGFHSANFWPDYAAVSNVDYPTPLWVKRSISFFHDLKLYRRSWFDDGARTTAIFEPVKDMRIRVNPQNIVGSGDAVKGLRDLEAI
ncbi:MAG: hypothetical protein AAF226_14050, partial [Verrucomicrobiota bacterium]